MMQAMVHARLGDVDEFGAALFNGMSSVLSNFWVCQDGFVEPSYDGDLQLMLTSGSEVSKHRVTNYLSQFIERAKSMDPDARVLLLKAALEMKVSEENMNMARLMDLLWA